VNGVHDMGGMQGFGPIQYEKDEPVFHERWEALTLAMNIATRFWNKWNIDTSRHEIERIAPAEYLRMSYYEKWHVRLVELLVKSGLVTRAEIESGHPANGSAKASPPLTADMVPKITANWSVAAARDVAAPPRFQVGQRVRARNVHPIGHTRLPRYARGKLGVIHRGHGGFVFPDTNAHSHGENPQQLYSVRFAARELWGGQAPECDAVYIDLWDDYLEPA
jgi:nitrile hydratase subunit beta